MSAGRHGLRFLRHHQPVSQRVHVGRWPGRRELREEPSHVAVEGWPPPVRVQVHLAKADPRLDAEGVGVLVEPGLELGVGGRRRVGGILDEELELLPEPPPDDRVVPVQPHAQRLARRQLRAHVVVDEPLQLQLGRRALPRPGERGRHGVDLARGDDDAAGAGTAPSAPLEGQEEERTDREKMNQRLPQPPSPPGQPRGSSRLAVGYVAGRGHDRPVSRSRHPGPAAHFPGVYQIAEV